MKLHIGMPFFIEATAEQPQQNFTVAAMLDPKVCVLKREPQLEGRTGLNYRLCKLVIVDTDKMLLVDTMNMYSPDPLWKPRPLDFVADVCMEVVMHKEELEPAKDIEHLSTYALTAYAAVYDLAAKDKLPGFEEK